MSTAGHIAAFTSSPCLLEADLQGRPIFERDVKRARQIVRIMDTLPVFDDIFLKLQHPLYGPDNADGSHGWTEEFSATSIREYKRFMAIATGFGEASPAKVVDEIWHSHITDIRRYPGDCQKCFGEFMHHYPYFGLGVNERNGVHHGERDELWDRYKVTLQRYILSFNELPPKDIWGDNKYQFAGGEGDCGVDVTTDPKVHCCSSCHTMQAGDAKGLNNIEIAVDPKIHCCSSCHTMNADSVKGLQRIEIAVDPKITCCSSCHTMQGENVKGLRSIEIAVDPKVHCCSSCHTMKASDGDLRSKM